MKKSTDAKICINFDICKKSSPARLQGLNEITIKIINHQKRFAEMQFFL